MTRVPRMHVHQLAGLGFVRIQCHAKMNVYVRYSMVWYSMIPREGDPNAMRTEYETVEQLT